MNLKQIKPGDYFQGTVKILRKVKPGPTILLVTDGTKSIDAILKSETKFNVDDTVEIKGKVSEFGGKQQIDLQSIVPSEKSFDDILSEVAKVEEKPFSVPSERFEKMKPMFIKIAERIRKAVFDGQPILIRHHNDTDGISSGLNFEKSITGLMEEAGIDPAYNLYRAVCKAPFYETPDMLKDLGVSKRLVSKFGQKKPLIIVTDNGSTPEDVNALKSMHALGHDIIVVDHHNPVVLNDGVTAIDPYVELHLNPYIFGLDGQTCCGMLTYELGRLIWNKYENKVLPAISSISDRCDIPETDAYIANSGMEREFLGSIGTVMDYVSYNMRFDTNSGIYEEVLENRHFVETLLEEVKEGMETQLQSTLPYVRTLEINGVWFSWIDLEKYTMRFTYPTAGKVIGAIHDRVAEKHGGKNILSIGHLSDMCIIRATHPVLPVADIIERLQKDLPDANVDGGGHECAGTIKFVSAHLDAVLENIKQQLKERKDEE